MRWPSGGGVPRGLDRAVETVISRSADLSGSQRAAIEAAIEASQDTEAAQ
jgi:hypothetical protein